MKEQEYTLPAAVNADFLDAILADERHLEAKLMEDDKPTAGAYPVDAFPQRFVDLIGELHEKKRFHNDFSAVGILFAASTAIGNSRALDNGTYLSPAMLWQLSIGAPSVGKSPPVDMLLEPLQDRDKRSKDQHAQAVIEWEAQQEERKGRKRGKEASDEEPPEPRPIWRPHIVGDITMEALIAKLAASPRGVGRHADEFLSWLQSMDAYRSGGDRSKWLTIFNGSQLTEIRKTAGEFLGPRPFVSVAGGIQTDKLSLLAGADDGFLHRLLVAWPDNPKLDYTSKVPLAAGWMTWWKLVLDFLLEMDMENGIPVELRYAEDAAGTYMDWDRANVDRINAANKEGDGLSAALYGKMDTYYHRLALVLELLYRACGDAPHENIEVRLAAVQGAQKLLGYFERTARKLHFTLFQASPVDRLIGPKLDLFDALPMDFATAEAIVKAGAMGIPERTLKRRLNAWSKGKQPLLSRDGQGRYRKLFEH